MAKAVGLSRSRFYDYVKRGVFPYPLYTLATRRPFYTPEMQAEVLAARQTGIGSNGEYVLFYERRTETTEAASAKRRSPQTSLLESLRSLGLSNLTEAQVASALAAVFPGGLQGLDEADVLRVLYRHLRRANGV